VKAPNLRTRPEFTTDDYRAALAGEGPLAGQWADKPHRLIYDLCVEIEKRATEPPPAQGAP
jgi:hypothetical protein